MKRRVAGRSRNYYVVETIISCIQRTFAFVQDEAMLKGGLQVSVGNVSSDNDLATDEHP